MLTWWIPRTASLIQIGCVGWSSGRIPSWIAFKSKGKSSHIPANMGREELNLKYRSNTSGCDGGAGEHTLTSHQLHIQQTFGGEKRLFSHQDADEKSLEEMLELLSLLIY